MHETIVAAVDLGTSRITAMLGKKDTAGRLSIIAEASVDSGGCICRGLVSDVNETVRKISGLIQSLEKKQKLKIERVYIGAGGQSVRSLEIDTDEAYSDSMAEDLVPEKYEILDRSTPLIIGRSSYVKEPLDNLKEKMNVVLAGYIIAAKALAASVLTVAEKEQGCALLDFGAGKTTLAVYKDNALKYLVTVPLGSGLITKDIASLKTMSEQEAENFKITSGLAVVEDDENVSDEKRASQEVNPIDPNRIVEARMDEILSNVEEQIKRAGYGKSLSAGIVITGGGAALQKLPEAIRNKTGYPVRVAAAREDLFLSGTIADKRPEHAQVIGLLALGNEHCVEMPKEKTKVEEKTPNMFDGEDTPVPQDETRVATQKPKSPGFLRRIKNATDKIAGDLFADQ